MRRSVGPDKTGAIDRKADRQTLDGNVVDDLVIRALQERRIDRGKRLESLGGETACKGYRVLLGDAHIEAAIGKFLPEQIEAGARRHCRGDGDDLVILACFPDQALRKHLRILWCS